MGRVTAISLAFYRALSEGYVAESYHQFLDAIGTGDVPKSGAGR